MSNLTKSIPADERKMLRKAFWRSFTLYAAVSPAKQGASGFCYSLMPFINKFYKNDEEGKKAALTRSMSYFNTTITLSTFIMGLVASMEKKNSEQEDFDASSINAVKSSLMGPLAGMDFVKLLMRKIPPLLRQDIRQNHRPVKLPLSVPQAGSACNRSYQWKWQ